MKNEVYKLRIVADTEEDIFADNLYDVDNNILGTHDGISSFTIGQRKGIGISGSREPLYVIDINKDQNSITLGVKQKLKKKVIKFKNINWLGGNILPKELDCSAKIRSTE